MNFLCQLRSFYAADRMSRMRHYVLTLSVDLCVCMHSYIHASVTFSEWLTVVPATDINCMLITVKVLESIFFAERVVSPWNSQPVSVGFTSLHRFKRTILKIDFEKFLTVNVDG